MLKLLLSLAFLSPLLSAAFEPEILPLADAPAAANADAAPAIPFLSAEERPDALASRPPLARLTLPDDTPFAELAAGWDREALRLRIVVNDKDHVPASDATRLWSADSVELGIDARGENRDSPSAHASGPLGTDDFKLIFGLLESGPASQVLASKGKLARDAFTSGTRIHHDPEGSTHYEIALPWALLGVEPGARPTLGLDFQVNDLARSASQKVAYNWGPGLRGGLFKTALLPRFRLGPPAADFAGIEWEPPFSWSSGETAVLHAGLRSDQPVSLRVTVAGEERALSLPGGAGWRFFQVRFPAPAHGAELVAQLSDAPPVRARQVVAEELQARIQSRLAELLARPGQHPLFVLHLKSLSALVSTDWGRVRLRRDSDPRAASASVDFYRDLLEGLHADPAEWPAYLDGRRSLLIAYVSPHDQTLQHYLLGLPRDWDETRAYPLFFELHGAGNDHPLADISRLSVNAKAQDRLGYDTPKVYAEIDRAGYWVHPFGRGNLRYTGIARIDVLEAYDHAHRLLKIDPDRRYLYGFSMGAGGTFNLAQRTPSRWAAACSIAPATGFEPAGSPLTPNLAMVPYKLICGELDHAMGNYREILADLAKYEIHPEARSIPKLGHQYLGELQKEKIDWLKTHVRRRPATFDFVTNDRLTNTCWGVTLDVRPNATEPARVKVRRDGQTVHLDSAGTQAISLDFSENDGLGLSGDVTVIWNGKVAYQGAAKNQRLTLPKP